MQARFLALIFFSTATLSLGEEPGAPAGPTRFPIARIGDQAIYEEDLQPVIGGQLLQLKNQEYELKVKALETLVRQRLVEKEAKSKGLSVEAFLEQTVDRNLAPWDVKELDGYYLAQRDRVNKPLAEVREQVEMSFLQARRQQARQGYLDELWRKAGVKVLLDRPRVDLAVDPSRLRGRPDAPVTIVEFADFQCPYCQAVEPVLKQVMDKYKGQVRLGFRDFPLRAIHSQAQPAAEAARCAGEQGKFWEYHDLLLASQAGLNPDLYRQLARTAGVDSERFEACLTNGKGRPQIENDLQSGAASGVTGTPSFYINGVLLSGSQSVSAFEKVIDSQLASTAPGPAQ